MVTKLRWAVCAGAIATLVVAADAGAGAERAAAVSVVTAKSFCLYSGVSDQYTGDGRVGFWFTLKNTGSSPVKVSVTPVRHYDDGELNESAMDTMLDLRVPAFKTKKFRSPL